MIPPHVYYQLASLGLLWLCVILHDAWPSRCAPSPPRRAAPGLIPYKRKRSHEPTPFEGLTHKPPCAACAHDASPLTGPPPRRPDPMPPSHRRPRDLDTARHFCPHAGGDDHGGLGVGHLRAPGHPRGGLWRQLSCRAWKGSCLATHGTLGPGKRLAVELRGRGLAGVAEGLGMRATARVFAIDPNTCSEGGCQGCFTSCRIPPQAGAGEVRCGVGALGDSRRPPPGGAPANTESGGGALGRPRRARQPGGPCLARVAAAQSPAPRRPAGGLPPPPRHPCGAGTGATGGARGPTMAGRGVPCPAPCPPLVGGRRRRARVLVVRRRRRGGGEPTRPPPLARWPTQARRAGPAGVVRGRARRRPWPAWGPGGGRRGRAPGGPGGGGRRPRGAALGRS